MKLLLTKPIVGTRDRGLPTESKYTYANSGDKVKVMFNNSSLSYDGKPNGYFVCEKDDQNFVVFHSQFSFAIDDKDYDDIVFDKIELTDDLLYPESTETFEDKIFE